MLLDTCYRGCVHHGGVRNRGRFVASELSFLIAGSRSTATSPLVAVFGQGLDLELGTSIRGVRLDPADPLCGQWIVLTLGLNTATALIARNHGNALEHNRHPGGRRFDVAINNDRSLVTMVARNISTACSERPHTECRVPAGSYIRSRLKGQLGA